MDWLALLVRMCTRYTVELKFRGCYKFLSCLFQKIYFWSIFSGFLGHLAGVGKWLEH